MSNIEQALKAALAAIDLYDYTMTVEESEKFAKAERLCKAALSDIEKCEPVGIFNKDIDNANGAFKYEAHSGEPLKHGDLLYTSPQPRVWVGLTYDEIESLYDGES